MESPEKFWDAASLESFNKQSRIVMELYKERFSDKVQKEKIEPFYKYISDTRNVLPRLVKLKIVKIKPKRRYEGIWKNFSWSKIKEYGIIKCIKNFLFSVKLSRNQILKTRQKLIIECEDNNHKDIRHKLEIILPNREYYKKLFTKKERLYICRDMSNGLIMVKKAKDLQDLYNKIGIFSNVESLGWIPQDDLENIKKTIKELSYENTN